MDTTFRLFDLIPIAISAAIFIVGLMIKNSINDSKSDLIANQVEVKEALTARYSEVDKKLEVHIGQDEQKFQHIGETMTRVETKLDHLATAAARR